MSYSTPPHGITNSNTSNSILYPFFYLDKIHHVYGTSTEIQLIYNDQPSNDFKSLFQWTHGMYNTINKELVVLFIEFKEQSMVYI